MFSRITDFPRMLWLLAVALLITMDQASKSYFSNMIPLEAAVEVTEWFNLTHRLNAGAAFSVLSDAGGWQRYFFGLFSTFVVTGISYVCLFRKPAGAKRWCRRGGWWRWEPYRPYSDWCRSGLS